MGTFGQPLIPKKMRAEVTYKMLPLQCVKNTRMVLYHCIYTRLPTKNWKNYIISSFPCFFNDYWLGTCTQTDKKLEKGHSLYYSEIFWEYSWVGSLDSSWYKTWLALPWIDTLKSQYNELGYRKFLDMVNKT